MLEALRLSFKLSESLSRLPHNFMQFLGLCATALLCGKKNRIPLMLSPKELSLLIPSEHTTSWGECPG